MGGGGFSEEPDNLLLDDFVLGLSGKKTPRVCFVPTASGDAQGYIDKFYNAFPPERAEATHLSLFRDSGMQDLRAFLLDQDVLYVGGGSTANMLAIWRVHGIDRIVREAWVAAGDHDRPLQKIQDHLPLLHHALNIPFTVILTLCLSMR